MCAEYSVKTNIAIIEGILRSKIDTSLAKATSWDERIKMSMLAPAIGMSNGKLKLRELVFAVNPFPNARLSQLASNRDDRIRTTEDHLIRIFEVALWKAGFEKYPCIIPMSHFCEPAYWGAHRGEIIEFSGPEALLFVPAIVIKPKIPATGKLNGFALLTHTASPQMLDYHHRLLVFLRAKAALEYLALGDVPPAERFEFLIENRYVPDLKTSVDRKMAKGWEKRVEQHETALAKERLYNEMLTRK